MSDTFKNGKPLLKRMVSVIIGIALLLIIFWIGIIIFIPSGPGGQVAPSAYIHDCQNNLRTLGVFLELYKNRTGVYPPIDGNKITNNWADYLRSDKINWGEKPSDLLFDCPFREAYLDEKGSYFFADPQNKNCFPDGKFTDQLSGKTPIAGDAYDPEEKFGNHGPISKYKINILLFDGTVRKVDPRTDKLGKKAYHQECLKGKFDPSSIKGK